MTAELVITDNREVNLVEAERLLAQLGDVLPPDELRALAETLRRDYPAGTRSYFIACGHGAYVVTRQLASRTSDAEGVRRAVAGLQASYG